MQLYLLGLYSTIQLRCAACSEHSSLRSRSSQVCLPCTACMPGLQRYEEWLTNCSKTVFMYCIFSYCVGVLFMQYTS